MSESRTIVLGDPQTGHAAFKSLWDWCKAMLVAGHRLVVSVRPETRTDAQNRLLHSRIGDVAKQVQWAGQKWDAEDMKRLLVSAWCRAKGESVTVVPALDGHGFEVIYRRTSKLSRTETVELSDYIMAWGDEKGVRWCPASLGREWAAMEHA